MARRENQPIQTEIHPDFADSKLIPLAKFVGKSLATGIEIALLPVTAPGEILTGYSALDDRKLTPRERYVDRGLVTVALFAKAAEPAIKTVFRAQDVATFSINAGKNIYRAAQKITSNGSRSEQ